MTPPPLTDNLVFEHCLSEISLRLPGLHAAIVQRDEESMRQLVRELRNTLGLLALPKLFQLSQDIECRRISIDPEGWDLDCQHFSIQLERIHYSLQQRLSKHKAC